MAPIRLLAVCICVVVAVAGGSAARGDPVVDWPTYLFGSSRSSTGAATAITPSNAAGLVQAWVWKAPGATETGQPGGALLASPTVMGGRIFIGANSGAFSAIDIATGRTLWSRNLGWRPTLTCNARGITSTATAAVDSLGRPTVYVGGGDGYLYALDAITGAVRWQAVVGQLPAATSNDYYNWASPLVIDGKVYDGISSQCDNPFVRGGLAAYDQLTGQLVSSYWAVPDGSLGGGVWTSPATDSSGNIFVTTGSGQPPPVPQGDMFSVVRLSPGTLARIEAWTLPPSERVGDSDWGSTPVPFRAVINGRTTRMVAACNKNGYLYAFRAHNIDAGPVWRVQIAAGTSQGQTACLPAPIWDGTRLFAAGPATTINNSDYRGAIRQLNPATGAFIWQRGLAGAVIGTPSLNGSNVIAAPTYDFTGGVTNGVYLLNATNGAILRFIALPTSREFAQPVFVGRYLLLATVFSGLNAYTAP